jgi:hypothetical protein
MARIVSKASGFIYLVSMIGITGSSGLNSEQTAAVANDLKKNCNGLPVCIGFGISTPDDAAKVSQFAVGVAERAKRPVGCRILPRPGTPPRRRDSTRAAPATPPTLLRFPSA